MTILGLWQETSLLPSGESTLAGQIIIGMIAVVGFVLREISARRQTARLREETHLEAQKLAIKQESERQAVELAVKTAMEKAQRAAETQAELVQATVRHDVRDELERSQRRIVELQHQLATKVDVNTRETVAARHEANDNNRKIEQLRESFNSLLGNQINTAERADQIEQHVVQDRALDADTNKRVRRVEQHTVDDDGPT